MFPFDQSTFADAFTRPGNDPRAWFSIATVMPDQDGQRSVEFDPEYGPLVHCKLHPSNVEVTCRVAGGVAGNGEGEWFPFLASDEVVVGIPEGDENAGCVILGRLNNQIDAFPTLVAGQDPSTNTFAFRRLRTPYVVETASSYLVRSASTGAFLGIDPSGAVTMSNADAAFLSLRADFLGLQNGEGDVLLQLQTEAKEVILQAVGTRLTLGDAASTFATSGTLDFSTSGQVPSGHAVTLEQVVVLMVNFLWLLAGPTGLSTLLKGEATGPTGMFFAGTFPAPLLAALSTWLPLAASPLPATSATPGGALTGPLAPLLALIQTALTTGTTPLSASDVTGLYPGFGRPGMRL